MKYMWNASQILNTNITSQPSLVTDGLDSRIENPKKKKNWKSQFVSSQEGLSYLQALALMHLFIRLFFCSRWEKTKHLTHNGTAYLTRNEWRKKIAFFKLLKVFWKNNQGSAVCVDRDRNVKRFFRNHKKRNLVISVWVTICNPTF
jgi:hypothetical protein